MTLPSNDGLGAAMSQPAERPVHFIHRGQVVEAQGLPPTTTVLNWLRERAQCSGTKEGCNEGDCGACMVAVAELQDDGQVALRNLNACLLFLPTLDGKALFTVEDVAGGGQAACAGQDLHPVQQALVDHHGSQCGFCTPGFVMTMWTQWEQWEQWEQWQEGAPPPSKEKGLPGEAPRASLLSEPTRQEWADALAGNLCRCTGYRPILDAAQACLKMKGPRLDRAALRAQLQALANRPALAYAADDPAVGGVRRFSAPRSSDELAQVLVRQPDARVLGGATDIGLWTNKAHRDVGHLVFTGTAADLRHIAERDGCLRIGAAVSLEAAWSRLARHWPALGDLWRRFASPPVRHAGTLAGNVANGSPIGDGPPVLMALRAQLVLRHGDQRRTVPLDDFYLGYQRNALVPGEFIEWIEVPMPQPDDRLCAWKISKRYDSDISAVCGGFGLKTMVDASTGQRRLVDMTIAFGGMAATVKRATAAEQALLGAGWNERGIQAAQAALSQDFQPLTDLRATADYRLDVARGLLQRLWLCLGPDLREPAAGDAARRLEVWR